MSATKLKKKVSHEDGRHICSLDNGVANVFRRESMLTRFLNATQISSRNPNTKFYFRSLAAVEKERKRHRETKSGRFIIHPLSMFRFYWEVLMVFTIYLGLMIVPINFIIGPMEDNRFRFGFYEWSEVMEIITDIIYLIDFIMTFFTGHSIYHKKEIHLSFRTIARFYMSTFTFYVDIICSISLISVMKMFFVFNPTREDMKWIFYVKLLGAVKILRLHRFLDYMGRFFELMRRYYYSCLTIRYMLLVLLVVHWLTCIYIIFLQIINIYAVPKDHFIYTYEYEMILMRPYLTMYLNCQFIVLSYLLCVSLVSSYRTAFNTMRYNLSEVIIFVIYSTFGFIFSNLLLILILQMILSMNASEVKYHSIISQLVKYMSYKGLRNDMKERIICYYDYRFQKKYFRESTIMDMLSETLRREINLYSCRSLIETVSILRDLPPDIISEVVFNLKHQVFLYNDFIVKAGTNGECMYFIANGTVAVSTPTGREICHLQDGAYFGEIALISNDQKRIANVIAIEICEVYRLDRAHFRNCFEVNSPFYKKIEQIAQERMEKTLLLEELHKKYLLDRTTKRKMGMRENVL